MSSVVGARTLLSASYANAEKCVRQTERPPASLLQCMLIAVSLAGASTVGVVVGSEITSRSAHVAGACIALDMAEAHGAIDEPRRKRILYSLANVASPYTIKLSMPLPEMLRTCAELRKAASRND